MSEEVASPKIAPALSHEMQSLRHGDMVTVIVTLQAQANLDAQATQTFVEGGGTRSETGPKGGDRATRLRGIITTLQAAAETSQGPVRAYLAVQARRGRVREVVPFWIFNGLSVTATREVIAALAARPDVRRITSDTIAVIPAGTPASTVEANISQVNAPALWALGYEGQGIVVANMDTGVDGTHPDLASRWRGGTDSWYDPYDQHPTTPTDLSGHGTWTMGVMVGGDAGGTAIGVAPQAQWIAVKMFNDAGSATRTAIHEGYQWLLDPDGDSNTPDAPHVVNNSWDFATPGCDLEFEPDLLALRAAGIVPVFAAGNSATAPLPGVNVSPANNPAAFAVGAVDDLDQIYVYGYRGPSSCGEAPAIFPELVAPGVGIRTTGLFGTYEHAATGTSMAAPHVAGGLALLLSAYPNLSALAQEQALLAGIVDLGDAGPDNTFGYGRLDLLAAYQRAGEGANLAIEPIGTAARVTPGAPMTYTLAITNAGPQTATAVTVTDTLPVSFVYSGATGAGWTCGEASGMVTCTTSALTPSAGSLITVTGTAPIITGTLTHTSTVTAATPDFWLADNSVTEQTQVALPQADLALAIEAPAQVAPGAGLTYTLTVTNTGPDPAVTVALTDTLPADFIFSATMGVGWTCSEASGTIECTRPEIPQGATSPLTITGMAPAITGTLTHTATVAAATNDPVLANNSVSQQTHVVIPPVADLAVAFTQTAEKVAAGDLLTYTVILTNTGPDAATHVTVTTQLPFEAVYGGASGDGWSCGQAGPELMCTRATLDPVTAPEITIALVAPPNETTLTLSTLAAAHERDPNPGDNAATATTRVIVWYQTFLPVLVR